MPDRTNTNPQCGAQGLTVGRVEFHEADCSGWYLERLLELKRKESAMKSDLDMNTPLNAALHAQQRTATTKPSANSYQVGGSHYKGHGIEPWDIIEAWGLNFWEGNALKYLLRRGKPGTSRAEDLQKAIHYLEKCLERAQGRKQS